MINGESEEEFFKTTALPFDTHLLTVTEVEDNNYRVIREVYRVTPTSPVITITLGTWSLARGLNIPLTSIYRRRQGLHGLVIRTGSLEVSMQPVLFHS